MSLIVLTPSRPACSSAVARIEGRDARKTLDEAVDDEEGGCCRIDSVAELWS